MNIVTDSYFEIGSTHEVCEDYAIVGNFKDIAQNDIHYAIISDGCSSSDKVDVGARLLTHAAESSIKSFYQCDDFYKNSSGEWIHRMVGESVLDKAKNCLSSLGNMDDTVLDATLLYAVTNGLNSYVQVYGDGCVIAKMKSKTIITTVTFETGAPFYLSYWDNDDRRYQYEKFTEKNNMKKLVNTIEIDHGTGRAQLIEEIIQDFREPLFLEYDDSLVSLSVSSDGIESYRSFDELVEMVLCRQVDSIVPDIVGFKNYGRDFLKRRVKSFHRKNKDIKIEHTDDIGIATIVFKDNLGV